VSYIRQQMPLFVMICFGLASLSLSVATAQTSDSPYTESIEGLKRLAAESRVCRTETDSLRAIRDLLFDQADSIAVDRTRAIEAGDAASERDLLARGQVVSEAIQFLSASVAQRDHQCRSGLELFSAALTAYRHSAPASDSETLDSLLQVQIQLARTPAMTLSQLKAPRIAPDDTPETLRWKADFTQDLIDRIQRWRDAIAIERNRLAQRQRIRNEAANLLSDEQFLDPGAGSDLLSGGEAIAWREFEGELSSALSGMIQELIAQMAGDYEEATADEILSLTDDWLRSKFTELVNLAQYLEQTARRREIEP
jgi:hypothetical protein